MSIEEDVELKTNSNNMPTMPNNEADITRDKTMISEKSVKEKKKKTQK